MAKLTKVQQAQIYCIKNGHARYVSNCFGYVHCGRCSEQIGDRLAGVFDMKDMISVGHKCKVCNKLRKKLSVLDKKILDRLEKNEDPFSNHEEILRGLTFKE